MDLRPGEKYNHLTVIRLEYRKDSRDYYRCICECGKEIVKESYAIYSGGTKSCGCLRTKHGHARKERLYNIWVGMRQRCRDTHSKDYPRYGGRGIRVCAAWNDYSIFRIWALAHGYNDQLSIDRIDQDGDYCPDNCRWADYKTQNNNRRSSVILTVGDESHTLVEWAAIKGIPYNTLKTRRRRGISIDRLFESEVRP